MTAIRATATHHGGTDPHIWMSARNAGKIAANMARGADKAIARRLLANCSQPFRSAEQD